MNNPAHQMTKNEYESHIEVEKQSQEQFSFTEKVISIFFTAIIFFGLYHWLKSSEIDQNRMAVVSTLKTYAEVSGHPELKAKIKESLSDGKITYYEYDDLFDLKEQLDKKELAQ